MATVTYSGNSAVVEMQLYRHPVLWAEDITVQPVRFVVRLSRLGKRARNRWRVELIEAPAQFWGEIRYYNAKRADILLRETIRAVLLGVLGANVEIIRFGAGVGLAQEV